MNRNLGRHDTKSSSVARPTETLSAGINTCNSHIVPSLPGPDWDCAMDSKERRCELQICERPRLRWHSRRADLVYVSDALPAPARPHGARLGMARWGDRRIRLTPLERRGFSLGANVVTVRVRPHAAARAVSLAPPLIRGPNPASGQKPYETKPKCPVGHEVGLVASGCESMIKER
jgi:hypothetical protein